MNKTELVAAITKDTGVKKADVEAVVASMTHQATNTLRAGEEFPLPGLGKLERATRAARTGRNPRTGEAVQIAASNTVKFKVASTLKTAVQ